MTAEKKTATTKKTATKKTAMKKAATETSAAKTTTEKKTARKAAGPAVKEASPVAKPEMSREDRFNRIQKEAYFLAEKGGFAGDPLKYWLEAEVKVRRSEL